MAADCSISLKFGTSIEFDRITAGTLQLFEGQSVKRQGHMVIVQRSPKYLYLRANGVAESKEVYRSVEIRLVHCAPRNKSPERLVPRPATVKLQCIAIATFCGF